MLSGSSCDFIIYFDTNYYLESVAIYTIGFNTFPNSPDYLLMFTELCIHFQKKSRTLVIYALFGFNIQYFLFYILFLSTIQPCDVFKFSFARVLWALTQNSVFHFSL